MACSPTLQKQNSCSCAPIDIANWCSATNRRQPNNFTRLIDDDNEYYNGDELDYRSTTTVRPTTRWRGIWRRIVKEKRRIFESGANAHEPYDAFTYSQNFDDGSATWVEPENLARSFSARFAAPSKMLRRFS